MIEKYKGIPIHTNYRQFPEPGIHPNDESKDQRSDIIFWSNDADNSIYKIGYPDEWNGKVPCNTVPYESETIQNHYYMYDCQASYKRVYIVKLKTLTIETVNFDIVTPPYLPYVPYQYIHMVTLFDRTMNSFNMCFSNELFRLLESSMKQWTNSIHQKRLTRLNSTQLWIRPTTADVNHIKIQMNIIPEYYFWVVETLLRNYELLDESGIRTFKLLYLMGHLKNKAFSEFFPDRNRGEDIMTYPFQNGIYKRELLNAPNIVFYLKSNANIKEVADRLCALFPDGLRLTQGVPRFNTRLNDNVYISFGGGNEHKFQVKDMNIPPEYQAILQSGDPKNNTLSERFSGHTLLNDDGSTNPILSYTRLLDGVSSFRELYTQHNLQTYYDSIGFLPIVEPPKDADEEALYSGGKKARTKRKRKRKRKSTKYGCRRFG
jgi:hypothetical protein